MMFLLCFIDSVASEIITNLEDNVATGQNF